MPQHKKSRIIKRKAEGDRRKAAACLISNFKFVI
jgi:hypothetical protein